MVVPVDDVVEGVQVHAGRCRHAQVEVGNALTPKKIFQLKVQSVENFSFDTLDRIPKKKLLMVLNFFMRLLLYIQCDFDTQK